jgi:hypothetical protein
MVVPSRTILVAHGFPIDPFFIPDKITKKERFGYLKSLLNFREL